jgi:hypothetical protein
MIPEDGNVFPPFPQRGDLQRDDMDAVKEVFFPNIGPGNAGLTKKHGKPILGQATPLGSQVGVREDDS